MIHDLVTSATGYDPDFLGARRRTAQRVRQRVNSQKNLWTGPLKALQLKEHRAVTSINQCVMNKSDTARNNQTLQAAAIIPESSRMALSPDSMRGSDRSDLFCAPHYARRGRSRMHPHPQGVTTAP